LLAVQRAATTAPRGAAGLLRAVGVVALVAIPAVLAFASGGYFDEARLWALLAAALTLAIATVGVARPLPRTPAGIAALSGFAALAAWTAASIGWAPLRGPAFHDFQRLLLYLLAFAAGVALLRARPLIRALEPMLASVCIVTIGYGLAARLLPALVHESHGAAAGGRLDQPLTYWNAVGAVAAIGLVLCARLTGDGGRSIPLRATAAGCAAALGMGIYLTYSRGALGAAAAGLLVLAATSPDRRQLRALVVVVVAAGLGALAAAPFPAVASLASGSRDAEGAVSLALLAAVGGAAALTARRFALREAAGALSAARIHVRRLPALAGTAVVAALAALVIATAASEHHNASGNPATGARAARLTSLQSHRYAYWKVALGAFADHPLDGLGSGSFGARWLQKRTFPEAVRDAHSLYFETAAELGLVGLAALATLIAGIVLAARQALRHDAAAAAGLLAALVTFGAQAGVDWLWEMPAVSLLALLAAAGLAGLAEAERRE
jgi:hypothetical protein